MHADDTEINKEIKSAIHAKTAGGELRQKFSLLFVKFVYLSFNVTAKERPLDGKCNKHKFLWCSLFFLYSSLEYDKRKRQLKSDFGLRTNNI